MVKNPGETPGVGTIRPLNPPVPTGVVEDEHGRPVAVAVESRQPPAVPRKSAPARTGGARDDTPRHGHRASPTGVSPDSSVPKSGVGPPPAATTGGAPNDRHGTNPAWQAPSDFSFLGAAAEQSPDTRSLDYMLAETEAAGPGAPGNTPKYGRRASPAGVGQAAAITSPASKALRVTAIEDRWEIDEEWWRTRSLSRTYYRVLLEDGQALTLYRDMLNGRWYSQRY